MMNCPECEGEIQELGEYTFCLECQWDNLPELAEPRITDNSGVQPLPLEPIIDRSHPLARGLVGIWIIPQGESNAEG